MLEEALEKLDAGEGDPSKVLGPIVPIAEGDCVVGAVLSHKRGFPSTIMTSSFGQAPS
jgi:hypothetical protein